MMKVHFKLSACLLVFLYLMAAQLLPALPEGSLSYNTKIDWQKGIIRVEAGLDIIKAGIRLPSGRMEAEMLLDKQIPYIARPVVHNILVDSHRTVYDTIMDGSLDSSELELFLESGKKLKSSFSRDLVSLNSTYEWRIAELVSLYVKHSVAIEPVIPDYHVPSRAYSGIIIYAKGKLPVRGEHREAGLEACLFPKIFDSSMNIIVERNTINPAALKSWGPVAYNSGMDMAGITDRVGNDPLRIIAHELFGSRRSGLVLSNEDAGKLLGSEANRELLRLGRIVLIID
ncbi:hypothetical protein MASR2M29_10150 [Spirochaetota bacterium]